MRDSHQCGEKVRDMEREIEGENSAFSVGTNTLLERYKYLNLK